jgi:hypothetical protein
MRHNVHRRVAGLLCVFLLAGCSPAPQTVAKCEFEARKARPDPNASIVDLMTLCMKAEGYTWTVGPDDCHVRIGLHALDDTFTDPACYQSTWLLEASRNWNNDIAWLLGQRDQRIRTPRNSN